MSGERGDLENAVKTLQHKLSDRTCIKNCWAEKIISSVLWYIRERSIKNKAANILK